MLLPNEVLTEAKEKFDLYSFPLVNEEIISINTKIEHLPGFFKPEMIVSFLKDHSLQRNWEKANPELTKLVISGSLFNGSIESLFVTCRNDPGFRKSLEMYLMTRFAQKTRLPVSAESK